MERLLLTSEIRQTLKRVDIFAVLKDWLGCGGLERTNWLYGFHMINPTGIGWIYSCPWVPWVPVDTKIWNAQSLMKNSVVQWIQLALSIRGVCICRIDRLQLKFWSMDMEDQYVVFSIIEIGEEQDLLWWLTFLRNCEVWNYFISLNLFIMENYKQYGVRQKR